MDNMMSSNINMSTQTGLINKYSHMHDCFQKKNKKMELEQGKRDRIIHLDPISIEALQNGQIKKP